MTGLTKFQSFIASQKKFFTFFKDSFFKPFSLDKMLEEQDEEHRKRKEELKKQSMESISKLKMIADLQYAQHKFQDRTQELDFLYQRRESNKKKQMDALEQLLSTIELDDDGYLKKKQNKSINSENTTDNNNNNNDNNSSPIERILQSTIKKQEQKPNSSQNKSSVTIEDLDAIFNSKEGENDYIDTKNFDFDSHFEKPKQFSEEEYSKVINKNKTTEEMNNNNKL
ncbi:hypothetical protein RB653_001103 [Dictyostelium firmibasis]|uniref:Uncharacterized protein n=1 Tax=Dictyostelium firmibasis TaxID=79012 RepID=A0AAN7Z1T8_9MYCE